MYIIGKFEKTGYIKYLGHLDLVAMIVKAFKRSGFEPLYTRGFNPQPNLSIVNPLPLGFESLAEYMQIECPDDLDLRGLADKVNQEMPRGIKFLEFKESKKLKLNKLVKNIHYRIYFPDQTNMDEIEKCMEDLENAEKFNIYKTIVRKKREIQIPVDIRAFLVSYEINKEKGYMDYRTKSNIGGNLRADYFDDVFNKDKKRVDMEELRVIRTRQTDIRDKDLI